MYNDFILVGPAADPARIAGMKQAPDALKKIAEAKAPFASRADDSGTHKAELKLWQQAGIDPKASSGSWYLETGSGMGATLNIAVGKQAYALTDRGTWLAFANKDDFKVLVEGDDKLYNQYGVILVNPAKHPNVKAKQGQPSSTGSRARKDRPQSPTTRSMASSSFSLMRVRRASTEKQSHHEFQPTEG